MARETIIHAWQKTKRSTYLDFDGTNDYISITADSALNFTGPSFTIEAWVYPDVVNITQTIYSKGNAVNNGYTFTLSNQNVRLGLVGVANLATTGNPIVANKWQHIAVAFDSSRDAKFYVDGWLVQTVAGASNPNTSTANQAIGRTNQIAAEYFNGKIAEVRVWNDERTNIEISNLKNTCLLNSNGTGLRADIDTTGLVAYYPLNEGTGTTVTDYSTTAKNGTLTNFPASPWLTTTPPQVYDRTYKAHTSRFIFSGIQSNLFSGVSAVDFVLPNITNNQGEEVFKTVENTELQIDYTSDNTPSTTIYNGFSRVITTKLKNIKSVQLTGISVMEYLSNGYTPKGSDGTYNFSYSSTSIEGCFKNLIYSYNNQNPPVSLNYTATSIQATGKSITKTFYNPKNFLVCFDSIFKECDSDWIWYIDSNNTVYLQQIASTPDFIFTYGKDFINPTQTTDATKIINRVRITNGTTHKAYTSQDSIDKYGQKIEVIRDERLSSGGMDNLASYLMNTNGSPIETIEATVIDISAGGTYDISGGLIGKVFSVVNTDETIEDKIISSATYYPEQGHAEITASDKETYISREIVDLQNSQFQTNFNSSSPDTYTEV